MTPPYNPHLLFVNILRFSNRSCGQLQISILLTDIICTKCLGFEKQPTKMQSNGTWRWCLFSIFIRLLQTLSLLTSSWLCTYIHLHIKLLKYVETLWEWNLIDYGMDAWRWGAVPSRNYCISNVGKTIAFPNFGKHLF